MKFTFALALAAFLTLVSAAPLEDNDLEAPQSPGTDACGTPTQARPFYRLFNSAVTDHLYTLSANEAPAGYKREGVSSRIFPSQQPGTIAIYRLYSASATDHLYTTSLTEHNAALKAGFKSEGVVGASGGDHLYTTSVVEREAAVRGGYVSEGVAAYVLPCNCVQQTMKFALVLTAFLTFVSAASLNLEARQSCGDPANASPFFRLYNSGDVDHFYTLDASEGLSATNLGYTSEGVSSHIFSSEQPGSVPLYRLYSPGVTDHFYTIDAAERDSAVKLGYYLEGVAGYIYPNAICGAVPFFRMYSANGGDHFYTTSTPERDSALGIGYADEGIAGYVYL
ncbi:hypothetical protein C0989_008944 [Termitomyces sp. Mn162]|nr:hypothetical protein C0989_008944 [Termitomyces sp. Mn162]